jgi:UDP-2,3-diacylglucosamine pyrophosphatase LpxH
MQRLVIVASDLEMGGGGLMDDFPQSGWLLDWLASRPDAERVELVFAGDTFDFLRVPVDGRWPRHIDAAIALRKWDASASAHATFLDGLAAWLRATRRSVWFLVGNHDLEIQFPEVQEAIRARLGAGDRVHFPGNELRWGELEVLHGHTLDSMFAVEGEPFLEAGGRPILNLPWGAVALLDVVMPLLPALGALDRLKPRERVFELLPEMRRLAAEAFWRYWTRDFWRDLIEGDPVKRLSSTMVREVVYRMGTADPELAADPRVLLELARPDAPRVSVVGHWHRAGWHTKGEQRQLMLGAFRNEYELQADGTIGRSLGNVHAEVWLDADDRVLRSNLVETVSPAAPEGYMPASIEVFRDVVSAQLEALTAR